MCAELIIIIVNTSQNTLYPQTTNLFSEQNKTTVKKGMLSLALAALVCLGLASLPFLIIEYARFRVKSALKTFGKEAQACTAQ
jgi:hypothetical protein